MGIDLNIIFMGYTILSILCFIRTILFMPKITFPFTIPDGYDYGYCEIIQNKVISIILSRLHIALTEILTKMLQIELVTIVVVAAVGPPT